MTMNKRPRRDNPRRAARTMAKKLQGWIKSALVGQVCSCCGDSLAGCNCGAQDLNPVEFQTEEA